MRELGFALHPSRSGWTAGQLARLYEHLPADTSAQLRLDWIHGAEVPASFYQTALSLQSQCLGERAGEIRNTMQAEVASIEGPLEALLFSQGSGIQALELLVCEVGAVEPLVQRLGSGHGLALSAAAMLTHSHLHRLDEIFGLIERSGIRTWRLVFDGRLTAVEQRAALERLSDLLVASTAGLRLQPIAQNRGLVRRHRDPTAACGFFDRRAREDSYSVDAVGRVNGAGNLFETPLFAIIQSPEYQCAIIAGERAMLATCGGCPFYGSCSGEAVARAARDRANDGEEPRCEVLRPLLQRIEQLQYPDLPRAPGPAFGPSERTALQAGVRVRFTTPGTALEDRCMLSAGTCAPVATEPRYHVGGLVPKPPWRAPTAHELSLLRADARDAGWRLASDIAIIRLPDEALADLHALCSTREGYEGMAPPLPLHDPRWAAAMDALECQLTPYVLDDRPIDLRVFYCSEPGPPTVTRVDRGQPDREVHVGLHLDSWEGTSLRRRTQIRNRMCVNLSTHPRYLLFINLTLAQMMRELGLNDGDDLEHISLFSGHKFMRRFPSYPVARIELRPFEAYIVPTGNVIHDGAANDGGAPDLALHLLGFFGLPD